MPGDIHVNPLSMHRWLGQAEYGTMAQTINVSSAVPGTYTIVNAVPNAQIVVVQCVITNPANNSAVELLSHVTTTRQMGPFDLTTSLMLLLPFSPIGWFATVAGEALDLAFTAGGCSGTLTYIVI